MSRWLRTLILLGGLLIIVVAVFFMKENSMWVVIRFPDPVLDLEDPFPMVEYEASLPVIMAVSFLLGVLATLFFLLPSLLRRAFERKRQRRFIDNLEGELSDLRTLPVTDPAPLEDIDAPPAKRRKRWPPRKEKKATGADESDEDALLAAALQDMDQEARR